MFNENRKYMGNDNYGNFGGCSKAKKAKPSKNDEDIRSPSWDLLPSVVLHDIFDLLNEKDRKNASVVCKNWRRNLFHPKWWSKITFKIYRNNLERARFYTARFGGIVSDATVKVNSLSFKCTKEFIVLLRTLGQNNNLRSLIIEPTHCRFNVRSKRIDDKKDNEIQDTILDCLRMCMPKLRKFSIGGVEALSHVINDILKLLNPLKVTHLGLASVKDDPDRYQETCFDPDLIVPFENLKVLSIDYEQLCDKFLQQLDNAKELERLIVHLHGVSEKHPGTSNSAWLAFRERHPKCELRLTVIHAFKDIMNLHDLVLRWTMPLTHLKVFFCEMVNIFVLEYLSSHFHSTLRSIIWVDSLTMHESSWVFAKPQFDVSPDPLVLMAWLCRQMDELVLYGYKYSKENLVAIGRLRGKVLKRLEIAEKDILFSKADLNSKDVSLDISQNIGKPWAPVKTFELHPVIYDPIAGDSDEYLLPIVLADLH